MPAVLPPLQAVRDLAPVFAASAQRIYDAWEQDADGVDVELGTGGICDLIADAMVADVHAALGDVRAYTKLLGDVQHVNVSLAVREGVFELDIPYSVYESGAGFTWTKKPGVVFAAEDVSLFRLSGDPADLWMYVEDLPPDEDDEPGEEVEAAAAPGMGR